MNDILLAGFRTFLKKFTQKKQSMLLSNRNKRLDVPSIKRGKDQKI